MQASTFSIGSSPLPRGIDMAVVVPSGSRGMKDPDPDVRTATAQAMLAQRYAVTPKFQAKCGFPPCTTIVEGYQRGGKRRKYCSPAHNTAACRYRQRQNGLFRVSRGGHEHLEAVDRGG